MVETVNIFDVGSVLSDFMRVVHEDARIGPAHISLFSSILCYCKRQGESPISVYSRDLMKQAKIAGGTYHRCIRDLHRYGFIRYVPSYNPVLGSLIYILKIAQDENIHHAETTR